MSKCTKGEWQWIKMGDNLVLAATHHGTLIVMDFVRKGMNSAQPRFAIREGNKGGLLKKTDEIDVANHPDARLIAAAPDLLEACEAWMKVESEMADKNSCPDLALRAQYRKQAVTLTETAIAKASVQTVGTANQK